MMLLKGFIFWLLLVNVLSINRKFWKCVKNTSANSLADFGQVNVEHFNNTPGARYGMNAMEVDSNTVLVFGGYGMDNTGNDDSCLNQVWTFNRLNRLWTFRGGDLTRSDTTTQVYTANGNPSGRFYGSMGKYSNDVYFVFGGSGYATDGFGYLNDFWRYTLSTHTWDFISGANTVYGIAVYGTSYNSANTPGSRSGNYALYKVNSTDLVLIGGYASSDACNTAFCTYKSQEVWRYDDSRGEWKYTFGNNTWLGTGSWRFDGNPSNYFASKNVYHPNNMPPGLREYYHCIFQLSFIFKFLGQINEEIFMYQRYGVFWAYNSSINQFKWIRNDNVFENMPTGKWGYSGVQGPSYYGGVAINWDNDSIFLVKERDGKGIVMKYKHSTDMFTYVFNQYDYSNRDNDGYFGGILDDYNFDNYVHVAHGNAIFKLNNDEIVVFGGRSLNGEESHTWVLGECPASKCGCYGYDADDFVNACNGETNGLCIGFNQCNCFGNIQNIGNCSICKSGWGGPDCVEFVCTSVDDCNGDKGSCIGPNQCKCKGDYTLASNCSDLNCTGINCNGHGACVVDGNYTASCSCDNDYTIESNCLLFDCRRLNNCSGSGTCLLDTNTDMAYCECDSGKTSPDCSGSSIIDPGVIIIATISIFIFLACCVLCLGVIFILLNFGGFFGGKKVVKKIQKDIEMKQLVKSVTDKIIKTEDVKMVKMVSEGSSAKLYEARLSTLNDEKCAYKIFNPEVQNEGLEKEIEVIFQNELVHSNIVKFYGITMDPGKMGIIMELCESDLADYISKQKLTNEEKLKILTQISEGLEFIHEKKMIHYDLKPQNILLDANKNVKICDFGLLKDKKTASQKGGTEYYQSPEVTLKKEQNEKVDVFAFGIIMFQVLENKLDGIYENESDVQLALKVANNPDYRPSLPKDHTHKEAIVELMKKCWSSDSNERPSFTDIKKVLKEQEQQQNVQNTQSDVY